MLHIQNREEYEHAQPPNKPWKRAEPNSPDGNSRRYRMADSSNLAAALKATAKTTTAKK